jgi:hypothetical protein
MGVKGATTMTNPYLRRRGRRRTGRRPGRRRWRLLHRSARFLTCLLAVAGLATVAALAWESVAWAQEAPIAPGVSSIPEVVNRMRMWLVGILVAVSTLFLTVGGFRYLWANGDPGEIDKAKSALRNSAVGYALAVLAPLFVTIVTGFVA